jgi:glycosyltransferase involved in cell wall biosynthesis
MRIGIIYPHYPPAAYEGGISHYSARLAQSLMSRGHKVYALALSTLPQPTSDLNEPQRIEIIKIQGPWSCQSLAEFKAVARKYDIDAFILQYSPPDFKKAFRIGWALRRVSCQKITAFHTLWGKGLDRLFGLLILWRSSKIIATNSEVLTILQKRLPNFLRKTYHIPIASAIDPSPCMEPERRPAKALITFFGMLYPGKGLYLILDILEQLRRKGYRFDFKFIGGGIIYHKSYEAKFRNEIDRRNLRTIVETLGTLPDREVTAWLNRSRFVFLPFESGLSDRRSSLMTALVHGKAVLTAPPVVDMPVFKNGINILWPRQPRLTEYLGLVERLLEDDRLVRRLEYGASLLSQVFNWDKIAEAYESALMCSQCSKPRRRPMRPAADRRKNVASDQR